MCIYDDLHSKFKQMAENMSHEELASYGADLYAQLNFMKEKNERQRQAIFTASTERYACDLADHLAGKPAEDIDASVEKLEYERQKRLKESCEVLADDFTAKAEDAKKKAAAAARKIASFELDSVEGKKKKPSTKSRAKENVTKTVIHKVNDPDCKCPHCGSEITPIGYKSIIEIKYIPAQIEVIEHRFESIACPSKCTDENGRSMIVIAQPEEPRLIDRSPATESLIAGVTYEKFIMGTPYNRLQKHFNSLGKVLSRQSMTNMTEKALQLYLNPLLEKMQSDLRTLHVVHVDETSLKCLAVKERKKAVRHGRRCQRRL